MEKSKQIIKSKLMEMAGLPRENGSRPIDQFQIDIIDPVATTAATFYGTDTMADLNYALAGAMNILNAISEDMDIMTDKITVESLISLKAKLGRYIMYLPDGKSKVFFKHNSESAA